MGKRNREKRAERKRDRQRRGPTPPRSGFSGPHGPGCTCGGPDDFRTQSQVPPPELVAGMLLAAARAHASGDSTAAAAHAAELTRGRFAGQQRTVATGASVALTELVHLLWQAGWLPVDAWEITRRRADAAATGLLADLIAEESARYGSAVDERWAAQVRQLDATVWWDRGRPHLLQWAERDGVDLERALLVTIALLAVLVTLPELPHILASPGTAAHGSSAPASRVDQKILARVRGLLAKAESTEYPEEAEALSAKAQELMNRHAFERALLDADAHRQQAATSTRLWLDNPYVEAKSHLVAAIAQANRCRSVFYPRLGFVALVGEEMDLEITELLAMSLLVQATRAMVTEGSQITRAGTSRTRSFRQSFLVAYATRIGERLDEATARAHDPTEDARLLPVLAKRSRVVEETFEAMFSHTVERSVSVTNGAGWHAGRAAADRADLTIERDAINA
jgi:uncharacterized protein DUF2786